MTATSTPTTPASAYQVGDIVRAPHWQRGRITGHRRAIVIGSLADSTGPEAGLRVWFYTLGAPQLTSDGPNTLAGVFPREVRKLGDIYGMSERQISTITRAARTHDHAHLLAVRAEQFWRKLKSARKSEQN
ncbi:DUF6409 family protein [Streptomyces sp. NRRL S-350]|uniref:DUF6409 family protein n=1 Tax=Streptomyces sp. NRRL S-350 TaxID=1463902 RepID=UPI0004C21303|nr:DUF6409 family protein [Streptomyces sp. NRRL S-350]